MALKDWADKIGRLTEDNARRQFRASIFVKLILVIGGATAAAVAQCVELAHSNGEFSVWTIVGIAASVIVAIGGGYLAFTEPDVSKTLEAARQSIEEARDAQEQMREFDADRARLSKEVRRGLELYNSMDVMRGAIEQSLGLPDLTAAKIVQTCLAAASNSLLVAFDFSMEDTWTIGVFRAHKARESDKAVLRCIAMSRKIPCDIIAAREWAEGVGVAGVAYSMGNEVIIPDMSAPELGTVFSLKSNARSYDDERYRSMVAAPIMVGQDKDALGRCCCNDRSAAPF